MKKIEIQELKTFLQNDSSLQTIFWSNVFFGLPHTEPESTYLIFNILSNKKQWCYNKDLIEFRIIGGSEVTENLEMKEYFDTLESVLISQNKDIGTLKSLIIQCLNDEYMGINEKDRKEIERTFTFSYAI